MDLIRDILISILVAACCLLKIELNKKIRKIRELKELTKDCDKLRDVMLLQHAALCRLRIESDSCSQQETETSLVVNTAHKRESN